MNKRKESKKYFLVADIDAFFASVEEIERKIKGLPLAVGGSVEERGVISSANYIARKYGIRSAMPTREALRLCPELILVPPDFHLYRKYSEKFFHLVEEYFPQFMIMSVDEALIQTSINPYHRMEDLLEEIFSFKKELEGKTGLKATIGGGPNPELAKLATNIAKPDGIKLLPIFRDELGKVLSEDLKDVPVEEFPGIGEKTQLILKKASIKTIGDLLEKKDILETITSRRQSQNIIYALQGKSNINISVKKPPKSAGKEVTFSRDIAPDDHKLLESALFHVCFLSGARASAEKLKGKTAVLKVKFSDFTTRTFVESLPIATNSPTLLKKSFKKHLQKINKPVRLMGVYLKDLVSSDLDEPALPSFSKLFEPFRKEEKIVGKFEKVEPALQKKFKD